MAVSPRSRSHFLAIDQGGHASRALVFDDLGQVVSRGLREVGERRPAPGWVEQDPEEIVTSIRAAVADAVGPLHAMSLAVGMATQRSSIVCWDRTTGEALSPVVSWQDRRAHRWLEALAAHADRIHARTGLRLTAHYGASKLRWCLDHLPGVRDALGRGRLSFGPLAAFLAFRLLAERPLKVDPANASRTLLWSLQDLDWDPELLDLFGIPPDALPACVPTRDDYGDLADVPGSRLSILTGDQSAALFALGAPDARTAYINLGTGAFVQCLAGSGPRSTPGLLTSIALQEGREATYTLEGTVNGAGSALASVAREIGVTGYEDRLSEWLDRASSPPLYLNAVSGLGSPWWVPVLESRFVGEGEPWQKMAAVAESIVFLVCVNLECMASSGLRFERILATGGLAWNDALCQRLSDLSGLTLDRPAEHEATARGTAFLLAGRPATWPDPAPPTRFLPREHPDLAVRYRRWRQALAEAIAAPSRSEHSP
jgi:glycerol kinase